MTDDSSVPEEVRRLKDAVHDATGRSRAEWAGHRAEIARLRGAVARITGPQLRVIERDPSEPQG